MTTINCPACHNSVPTGRFCAVCGQQLQAAEPAPAPVGAHPAEPEATALVPVAHTQPFIADIAQLPAGPSWFSPAPVSEQGPTVEEPQPSTRSSRLGGRSNRTTGIATITVALLAAAAYGIFGFGAETHTITGDLSLTTANDLSAGDSCQGTGGYSDITPGTQVVVEDDTGKTLATSAFGPGTYDGTSCVFQFTFTDVPKAAFYRVQQNGNRGVLQYSYAEMVSNNWSVHLTLGNN